MKIYNYVTIRKIFLISGLAIILISLYCYGSIEHLKRVNRDFNTTDQGAYMDYAKKMYETNYSYIGDRNRMPVYPFLQSLLYNTNLTDQEYFVRGKYFNIVLSLIILSCLFLIFQKYFPVLQAVTLLLIIAFTIFIFKAAYFQCELLFYFLNFCGFLLMCKMLSCPSWKLGVQTGIVMGIAHLTKASVLPGLILFILVFIIKEIYILYVRLKNKSHITLQDKSNFTPRILSIVFVILTFLGTVYPYITTSKRIFGRYFYNVNSTFYMWYDSWEEAKQGTRAYGDRKGWPKMPPELIPSPGKYLREHTTKQIISKILYGLKKLISKCINSYGYFKYFLIYFIFSLTIITLNLRESIRFASKYFFLILFSLLYFFGYLLLYAWYGPILYFGNRLILAQFLPFLFAISIVISVQSIKRPSVNILSVQVKWFYIFNVLILGIFVGDLYFIITDRILTTYGGN